MKKIYFLLIALLCSATMVFAYDAEIDGIYYNLDETDKTAEVRGGRGVFYSGDIIIPEKVTYDGVEYSVTSIGEDAFYNRSSLTSITIPNSVTSIGDEAFYYCSSLTSITIPNSVTSIGSSAFSGCSSLTSVTIGNSVTSIGEYAFYYCSSLTSVQWNAKKCSDFRYDYDGHSPFNGCEQITSFTFGDNVEHIPAYLCYGMSKLTSITISNSVTSIGDEAFYDCSSLTSITIPNSVTSIGSSAFSGCSSLTSVTIGNSVTSIGEDAFFDCSSLTSVQWNAKKCSDFDYRSPFVCWKQITSFTFGDNVEHIPAYLCDGMSELTSITIPNSVTSIGVRAFSNCLSLTSITIPNSVTEIGGGVFYNCTALKSIVFSTNMNSLSCYVEDNNAVGIRSYYGFFQNCSSLESITIPNSIVEIGDLAFEGCTSLVSIEIPNSVTEIGGGVFAGCKSLKTIKLSENIKALNLGYYNSYKDWGFFEECTSLESITITNNVTEIGSKAFYGCSSLTSIEIPNSVTLIGSRAFSGCSSLTSITIPNSVTEIGYEAFSGCIGLTSIEIPNSVIYLGEEAFANCWSLRYAKLGNGFRGNTDGDEPDNYLGEDLFYFEEGYYWVGEGENEERVWKSSPLDTLICEFGDDVEFDVEYDHPFATTKNLRYFQGPAKLVNTISEEVQTQFSNKLTEVHITDGELDENGFNYINRSKKSLHTIDLAGTTNTAINDLAFYDCYKLENLMLPGNLETIGFKAVAECYQLKEINIPASVVEINDAAFENCRSIKSITFGGQAEAKSFVSRMSRAAANGDVALQRIGNWAFYNCHALENLVIPEGVTEVGDAAFYGCTYLDSLALPSTTQRIGDNCFALCSRMKQINVNATVPPTIFAKTFFDVNRNIPVIVPEGAREAYANDEYWGEFINVIESDEDTSIENTENANVAIYSVGGVLYVDGLSADYQVFDVNGRLVYSGRDAVVSLPRGVYVVVVEGEVEKVVL